MLGRSLGGRSSPEVRLRHILLTSHLGLPVDGSPKGRKRWREWKLARWNRTTAERGPSSETTIVSLPRKGSRGSGPSSTPLCQFRAIFSPGIIRRSHAPWPRHNDPPTLPRLRHGTGSTTADPNLRNNLSRHRWDRARKSDASAPTKAERRFSNANRPP
jgi:hypothetical protein